MNFLFSYNFFLTKKKTLIFRTMSQFISGFSGHSTSKIHNAYSTHTHSITMQISRTMRRLINKFANLVMSIVQIFIWQPILAMVESHTQFDLLIIFNYSNQKSNRIIQVDELRSPLLNLCGCAEPRAVHHRHSNCIDTDSCMHTRCGEAMNTYEFYNWMFNDISMPAPSTSTHTMRVIAAIHSIECEMVNKWKIIGFSMSLICKTWAIQLCKSFSWWWCGHIHIHTIDIYHKNEI